MKKGILFILFLFVISQFTFSQIFLGGSLSYQYLNTEVSNNSSSENILGIAPILGYRINNFDLGLSFIYQFETSSSSSNEITNIGVGIFGGYRFLSFDRFSIAGRFTFQYINSNQRNDFDTGAPYYYEYTINTKLNIIGINISPIFEFSINDNFALYTSIGNLYFLHSWGEATESGSIVNVPKMDIKIDSFGASLTTAISLGFYIYF